MQAQTSLDLWTVRHNRQEHLYCFLFVSG